MSELSPFIDQLRGLVVMSSVIGRSIKIKRHGHEFHACCPFHDEKSPSFTINDQKGFYHCFGCGAHGDTVKFMMDYHKLPFMEALKQLADMAGVAMPTMKVRPLDKKDVKALDLLECTTAFFEASLGKNTFAMDYLAKRGLDEAIIKKFRLGLGTNALIQHLLDKGFSIDEQIKAGVALRRSEERGAAPYARFRDRLMIPICDGKGKIIAFGGRALLDDQQPKYMNSPETDLFHKSRVLYGLNHIKNASDKNPVVVVEGYFDVITALQAGINAVAPLGTALTTEQMQILWRFGYDPILCFDGDKAGQKAMIRAAYHALPLLKPGYSFRFAMLPVGQDPDSMIRGGGSNKGILAFEECMRQAKPMADVLCDYYMTTSTGTTPETKARHKQEFLKALESIENKDIRSFYKQAFFDRTYAKKGGCKGSSLTVVDSNTSVSSHSLGDTNALTEKILLVTLLNHPTLISVMAEHLVQMDLTLQGATELVQHIMASDEGTWEKGPLTLDHPLCSLLQEDENLTRMAPFARKEASLEEAEAGFLDSWNHYTVKTNLKRARDDHKKKLKQSWDLNVWNALKHIQLDLQKF
ncbi:MAG: DNA primase [Alphaproteobacteria bacterium]|nr:DNA primase [Alphaproteobacteria bacterium]